LLFKKSNNQTTEVSALLHTNKYQHTHYILHQQRIYKYIIMRLSIAFLAFATFCENIRSVQSFVPAQPVQSKSQSSMTRNLHPTTYFQKDKYFLHIFFVLFFLPHILDSQVTRSAATLVGASATVNGSIETEEKVNGEGKTSENGGTEIRLNVFEKARTVTSVCTSGTMCTVSATQGIEGAPFGSFVDYVLDDNGLPVLLMNDMSMHTINIAEKTDADGGASMVTLFTQLSSQTAVSPSKGGLQDSSRCSLTGKIKQIPEDADDMGIMRMRYSLTHTYADQVMDSPKFSFYRLEPEMIYFVGGFGVSSTWVDVEEYKAANPDILAGEAAEILERINRENVEDLMLTAQHILNIPEAQKVRATGVDRLGMDVRVTSPMGTRRNKLQTDEFRIGFRIPVRSVEDAKSEIIKVFQEAWEKGNGVSWGDDEMPGEDVPIMKTAADDLE